MSYNIPEAELRRLEQRIDRLDGKVERLDESLRQMRHDQIERRDRVYLVILWSVFAVAWIVIVVMAARGG